MIKPLVITPKPYKDESIQGFILRASEENGYASPYHILRYAGLSESETRMAKPPAEMIAGILGGHVNTLDDLGYVEKGNKKRKSNLFKVNGNKLGKLQFRLKKAHICPDCIKEKGYIDKVWDLKYFIICPRHKRLALTECPSCRNKISWYRPGLLICRCGYDFYKEPAQEISDYKTIGLQELVWRKLHNEKLSCDLIKKCNFSIRDMEKMSLATLLGLIERFGFIQEDNLKRGRKLGIFETISLAADIFADWPKGLFRFLHGIAKNNNEDVLDASIIKQYSRFYNSIFKSTVPKDEVSFIRTAFLEFGFQEYKGGRFDKRQYGKTKTHTDNIVGIVKVAQIIGVKPVTVRNLIKHGIIDAMTAKRGSSNILLFDVTKRLPRKTKDTRSIPVKEIGKRVGLPVSVLLQLRIKKVFKVNYIAGAVTSFHHKDVAVFERDIKEIISNTKIIKMARDGYMEISSVMRMHTGSAGYKANVISELFSGKIKVAGRLSDKIGGLVVKRSDVQFIIRKSKLDDSGTYSVVETSKILSMDFMCIDWLISKGYLSLKKGFRTRRIEKNSVDEFRRKYISCNEVAKKLNSSSTGVVYKCRRNDIGVLYANRKNSKIKQPFIRRAELHSLTVN